MAGVAEKEPKKGRSYNKEEQRMKIAKLLAAGLALLFGAGIACAGTLDDIAKRGELRVAVQTQGPPFSMVD